MINLASFQLIESADGAGHYLALRFETYWRLLELRLPGVKQ